MSFARYESDFISDYYDRVSRDSGGNLNNDKLDLYVDDTVQSSYPDRFESLKDFNDNFVAQSDLSRSIMDVINRNNSKKRIQDPMKLKGEDKRVDFQDVLKDANINYYKEKNKYRMFDPQGLDKLEENKEQQQMATKKKTEKKKTEKKAEKKTEKKDDRPDDKPDDKPDDSPDTEDDEKKEFKFSKEDVKSITNTIVSDGLNGLTNVSDIIKNKFPDVTQDGVKSMAIKAISGGLKAFVNDGTIDMKSVFKYVYDNRNSFIGRGRKSVGREALKKAVKSWAAQNGFDDLVQVDFLIGALGLHINHL